MAVSSQSSSAGRQSAFSARTASRIAGCEKPARRIEAARANSVLLRVPARIGCPARVIARGLLVAGFSLQRGPEALTLAEYDACCTAAGLSLVERYATWDRDTYTGGDYAVSVHRSS